MTSGILTVDNKYGYRYNVNNPTINKYYLRFLKWKGLPLGMPISDEQRKEFEKYMDNIYNPPENKKI